MRGETSGNECGSGAESSYLTSMVIEGRNFISIEDCHSHGKVGTNSDSFIMLIILAAFITIALDLFSADAMEAHQWWWGLFCA